jgi:hypothetical protein
MKDFHNSSEYIAWAIYTGTSGIAQIANDGGETWAVGAWDALNKDAKAQEIQRDIDARINLIIGTFTQALPHYRAHNRYFVMPEFFFRCKQGAYPQVKIEGKYPVEYIQAQLGKLFSEAIQRSGKDNFNYIICSGSILTTNIVNYDVFFKSRLVTERFEALNKVLKNRLLKNTLIYHKGYPRYRNQWKQDEKMTTLDIFMHECRINPLATFRNRAILFEFKAQELVTSVVYEKQYKSTVDLTFGEPEDPNDKVVREIKKPNMLTEWMANHPSYSTLKGDKHTNSSSTNSIIASNINKNWNYGMEICLDHRLQRLRRTVKMTHANGADADTPPINIQINQSGGMQLKDYSIAVRAGGVILNVDGCDVVHQTGLDGLDDLKESTIFTGMAAGVYAHSIQAEWEMVMPKAHAHSQLAFATDDAIIDGFNNALGSNNQKVSTFKKTKENPANETLATYLPEVKSIDLQQNEYTNLFAAGIGELHCYRLKQV